MNFAEYLIVIFIIISIFDSHIDNYIYLKYEIKKLENEEKEDENERYSQIDSR